jgi:ubiquinone/menaquinone biosynthesis C-methylase UbiE
LSVSDGAIPSPNIWNHPETYEVENRAVDPDRRIEAAMRSVLDWSGRDLLDLGCGTGFHLPRWAYDARSVVGVEPNHSLAAIARRRTSRLANVTVLEGAAQAVPLPDASVDVVHARWAYFFGPGCEPGLAELDRVVRRGGAAVVVDVDATRSTFGRWFSRALPRHDARAVERFWSRRGWTRRALTIRWAMPTPDDLADVVRIEFAPDQAELVLAELDPAATEVDYAVNLWWRRF